MNFHINRNIMKRQVYILTLALSLVCSGCLGVHSEPTKSQNIQSMPCSGALPLKQTAPRKRPPRTRSTVPSAICKDGTESFSASRQGTCSHHGGVSEWL